MSLLVPIMGTSVVAESLEVESDAVTTPDDTSSPGGGGNATPIDPELEGATGEVDVLVYLEEVDGELLAASEDGSATLQAHAAEAQAPLEEYAEETAGVDLERSFWITSAALVTVDLEAASLSELAGVDGVERLSTNDRIEPVGAVGQDRPSTGTPADVAGPRVTPHSTGSDVANGIDQLNAPDVWRDFGVGGEGVTIAILDSGVDPDHPDIDLYTDDPDDPTHPGGWAEFDERGNTVDSEPHDSGDHGTHVSGTAAGGATSGTAIGVAPDARLIHGKVLDEREGTTAMLYGGIEWAIDQDADVIGMSLGAECGAYQSGDVEHVRNVRKAGAVPVAAIGNDGDGCSGSPGNVYDAVGVGAVESSGSVWRHSGGEVIDTDEAWGSDAPADWPEEYVTPTVVAPGVNVYSALPGDDYGYKRGTSMATPHVAGTVALMQSATERELGPAETELVLRETAHKPDGEPNGPDTRYGDGIVDAYDAVDELLETATVEGTITDEVTGGPIQEATVSLEDGERSATTADDGTYELRGVDGDRTGTITVDADGYEPHSETVEIPEDETITIDATLAGDSAITLEVEDAHFKSGLTSATVTATGDRGPYPGTHEGGGTYLLEDVPGNAAYDVEMDADGYEGKTVAAAVGKSETKALETLSLSGDATVIAAVEDEVTGHAIANAALSIEREDGRSFDAPGTSDGDGILEVVVPGTGDTYAVAADADGYRTGSQKFSVGSQRSTVADVALAGDVTLEVPVEDAHFETPVTDATVEADGERGTYPGVHDGDGTYVLEGVPSLGEYELTVEAEGYVTEDATTTLEAGGTRTLDPTSLSGDATLEVTVEDESETPIEGASVTLERGEGTFAVPEPTDGEGGLQITVPGTGEAYTVEATAEEYATNATTSDPVTSEATESVTVTLAEADGIPGFGPGVAVVALAAVVVTLLARRQ
ncbi:S8 family serine peptidase [Natrialbaceae archaeon A-gly3]